MTQIDLMHARPFHTFCSRDATRPTKDVKPLYTCIKREKAWLFFCNHLLLIFTLNENLALFKRKPSTH